MTRAFDKILDEAEFGLARSPLDGETLIEAISAINSERPSEISDPQLERMFQICVHVLKLGATPAAKDLDQRARWLVPHLANEAVEAIFSDEAARKRGYIADSIQRRRAFDRPPDEWEPTEVVPSVHLVITKARAAEIAKPYLKLLETALKEDPIAHLKLVWAAIERPVVPMLDVVLDWLDQLDAQRRSEIIPRASIERAFALNRLTDEGRQRVHWSDCTDVFLPLLNDNHALLAANAALYLGRIYADRRFFIIDHDKAASLPDILHRITQVPVHRACVAGGFLNGIGDCDEPFGELRAHLDGTEFDVEAWVLDVLACSNPEPYLPGTQAFWFYVHEAFCASPDFVARLIDAGHDWVAMMCATEVHDRVDGMQPILERLARIDDPEISQSAQRWLNMHYA